MFSITIFVYVHQRILNKNKIKSKELFDLNKMMIVRYSDSSV